MAVVPRTLTLTEISGGQTGSGAIDTINANFAETAQAFNSLAEALSNRNAIVRHCVPVASGVGVGDLVYWSSGCYCKAQALLEARPGLQGQSIEAECAHVDGVVLEMTTGATDTEATCNLLCGGCWSDADVVSSFLGDGVAAEAGVYYLSPESAGKVTKDPGGSLRQPVLTLYDNTTFGLGLFYMAHDNHFHATYTVPEWTSGSTNTWTADIPIDSGAVGELSSKVTAIFSGGVLMPQSGAFSIASGATTPESGAAYQQITYSGATDPGANKVVLFNHYPFAYGSPVVRLVQTTDSSSLTVKTVNGIVTLTPNDFILSSGGGYGSAFTGISGGTIYTTPVINTILAGAGITVDPNGSGSVTVANDSLYGKLVDPDTINHNGTTVGADGTKQYVTFPAGRSGAYMLLQKNVTGITSGAMVYVGASVIGSAGLTADVALTAIQSPSSGAPVAASGAALGTAQITFTGTDSNITYAETSSGALLTSGASWDGTLIAKVTPTTAPAADVNLLRIGFVVRKA